MDELNKRKDNTKERFSELENKELSRMHSEGTKKQKIWTQIVRNKHERI